MPDGVVLSAKVDRTTKTRIEAIASERGQTISAVVDGILTGYLYARRKWSGPRAQSAFLTMLGAITSARDDELKEFFNDRQGWPE